MNIRAPVTEDWALSVDSREGSRRVTCGVSHEDAVVSHLAVPSFLVSLLLSCLPLPDRGRRRAGGESYLNWAAWTCVRTTGVGSAQGFSQKMVLPGTDLIPGQGSRASLCCLSSLLCCGLGCGINIV